MPKIGKALKSVVEITPAREPAGKPRARPTSPLMNINRRKVFQHILLHPCSDLAGIASGTRLSRSTAAWHLGILAESGYAERHINGKSPVYAPAGMVRPQDVPALAALAGEGCASLYAAVADAPGSDLGTLSQALAAKPSRLRPCIAWLTRAGLVSKVMDGRHARFFQTERLKAMVAETRSRHKAFIKRLMARMAEERLSPEIRDMKRGNIRIMLTVLGREYPLDIPQASIHPE